MSYFDFDYYGNLIKFEVDQDVDGVTVLIISTSKPIEDDAEERDIKFHCQMDYSERAEQHFLKTGDYL